MSEEQKLRKWVGVGYAGRVAKAALVGIAALTAKVSAEAPAGMALVNSDAGKTTALHPYSEGAQSRPRSEFNPDNVTPELLEHLSTFMKNPERFIRNVQQQDQKREQRQEMRRLVEEARENPEVLKSLRKLFEEIPGKKSSETNRMKRDLGTERLTPEKVNPEVWESVRKMLTERRDLNDNTGTAVVLVHGIADISGSKVDCQGGYWGDAISYLNAQGYSDVRTVQYYSDATHCTVDLHDKAYQDLCDGFVPGSEGTNNEDLNHISCLLVQYLNQNFAGQNVILVGHSMGGIVIRNAMRLVQENGGQFGFPDDIGHVTDAVTFNSPHAGVAAGASLGCLECTQVKQLTAGSDFMNTLTQNAQNPQTSAGFTQWTVVGSECDPIVGSSLNPDGAANAVAMDASHAIMFTKDNPATCYDHGGALHDNIAANDAAIYSCDTNPNVPCGTDYQNQAATVTNWVKTTVGSRGLQTLYKAVQQ